MPVTRSALASRAASRGQGRAGTDQGGDLLGQALQPAHPLALAAELRMEGDVIQQRHARFQPCLAVEIPEVPRVGEAGAQHTLVAGDRGGAAVGRLDIGDEAEIGRRRTVGVAEREVALVDAHGDLHDLGRQVHVGSVDAAEQRHRPLDQPGHLVEQAGVVHHLDLRSARQAPDIPSMMMRLRSSASTSTCRSRSFAAQSAPEATANAPGAWKRWPSVRLAAASPCPSSSPSRRSNGTTAPSSRQTMRRSGRTQTKLLLPPQRIDFGQGKRRSSGGTAAAITDRAGAASVTLSRTQ